MDGIRIILIDTILIYGKYILYIYPYYLVEVLSESPIIGTTN